MGAGGASAAGAGASSFFLAGASFLGWSFLAAFLSGCGEKRENKQADTLLISFCILRILTPTGPHLEHILYLIPTALLNLALHLSKLLRVKLRHLLAQLKVPDDGLDLWLVDHRVEPAIGVLEGLAEGWL